MRRRRTAYIGISLLVLVTAGSLVVMLRRGPVEPGTTLKRDGIAFTWMSEGDYREDARTYILRFKVKNTRWRRESDFVTAVVSLFDGDGDRLWGTRLLCSGLDPGETAYPTAWIDTRLYPLAARYDVEYPLEDQTNSEPRVKADSKPPTSYQPPDETDIERIKQEIHRRLLAATEAEAELPPPAERHDYSEETLQLLRKRKELTHLCDKCGEEHGDVCPD